MSLILILLAAALLVQQPASPPAAPSTLDFEVFRTKVQPIFLNRRGEHARCVSCHASGGQTPRLQRLSPGATTWDEEQSRKNFEEIKRLVAPGDPLASRLLTKPLAVAAGGDPFHIGSKHWASQNDPEWQVLAAWVRTGSAAQGAASATSAAAASLDFEYYRTHVEPIFLKPRQPDEGSGNDCVACHAVVATRMRLQPLSPGATSWSVEQSRANFAVVSRLVVGGEPLKSPLLRHLLAVDAGGDPEHTGGKFWTSQDNPEWQTLAAWVRTGSAAAGDSASSSTAAVTLDYEFFKTRVQPIFLARRGEHARCVSCHRGGQSPRLQPLSPGATTWDEAQSRKNFEELKRLVAPGDPLASRLLTKPLAVAAGGDPFHIGSKHWASQNDPEWQTLSAWVRGQTVSTNSGK